MRFFRTANGVAYGFTVGGKVYLDPEIATAETAVHELTHLWGDMLRKRNPKEWENVVKLMKGTSVWEEVKSAYPELKGDDEIADEVLAHFSGRRGAERLREAQRKVAREKGLSMVDRASAVAAIERVKDALNRFWRGVADLLGIHFKSAEEVADAALADILNGRVTGEASRKDGRVRKSLGDGVLFAERQKRAVRERGVVPAGLNDASITVEELPMHPYEGRWTEARSAAIEDAYLKYSEEKEVDGKKVREPKPLMYDNFGNRFTYTINKGSLRE